MYMSADWYDKAAVVALVDAGSEFFQVGLEGEKMTHGEAPWLG
jgi:hypothetical protein